MYSFEGEFRRKPQQSFAGASKKEKRDELLQRASAERQKREDLRRRTQGSICIQSFVRGTLVRIHERKVHRLEFDRIQEELHQQPLDEASLETLWRSFLFFYREEIDSSRLIWLNQHLLRQIRLVASLVCTKSSLWKHRLEKLLHISLRYLVRISKLNSPIAIPMRILEVFTNTDTYSEACGSQNTTVLLSQIFFYLTQKGFFKQMCTLLNEKVPSSLESSPDAPTPLAGCIFSIFKRPIVLVSQVQDPVYRNYILQGLSQELFCPPFTEQIEGFVLPALISGSPAFPFAAFLESLLLPSFGMSKAILTVQPSPWLLNVVLQLASQYSGLLSDAGTTTYLQVLGCLSPTIRLVEGLRATDTSSDSDDDESQYLIQNNTVTEDVRHAVEDAITLMNESWHVQLLLNAVERTTSQKNLKLLCCVGHDLLTHHKLSVYTYRLLHTLAFKSNFLKELWQTITSASTTSVFGSSTLLLQVLARGLPMNPEDQEEFLPLLALFCSLFSYLLLTLHDAELYGDSSGIVRSSPMPFTLHEVVRMSLSLRDVCLGLIEFAYPDSRPAVREDYRQAVSSVSTARTASSSSISLATISSSEVVTEHSKVWSHLFKVVVNLVRQLYMRDSRQSFSLKSHWISQKVHIPMGKSLEVNFRRGRLRHYRPFYWVRVFHRDMMAEEGPPLSTTEVRCITVLRELPFVIPFTDRVMILLQLVAKDKSDNQGDIVNFLSGPQIQVLIRRNYIYEDAFDKLSIDNEPNLKLKMRVQLVNAIGLDEAGIDGGGIFREFLSELLKTAFDPNRGFFRMTLDNLLYPNPNVIHIVDNPGVHYYFIGRMLGKALYENMLVELPLAAFFLTKLLSRQSGNVDIHHLDSLDPVMYRNLLYLKHYEGDVSELGLDFTVINSELGETHVEELKVDGSNIPVTGANRIEYIHLVADYKLNRQIRSQCEAFRRGLADVVNLEWLQMFDARELQVLISGASIPVDLEDLRSHVNYAGGYSAEHVVIKNFWKVVENLDDRQRRQLLKFVTSCSRPPLLGFKELYPAFCIQNAGPEDRLPTASTCMNLLKLPEFYDENVMKTKLLYAIESCSGFELS